MKNKQLEGVVVSDTVDKTVVVLTNRYVKHPKYKKYLNINKKYKAHDENNEYKKDDKVVIQECRPISGSKQFKVISKQ